jgi:aspartate-semialdehyde dehydrogenase
MDRMGAERDFAHIDPVFFTTSNVGGEGPLESKEPLKDASSIADLKRMDVIVTCQGGDYTNDIHPKLRSAGWNGSKRNAGRPVCSISSCSRTMLTGPSTG